MRQRATALFVVLRSLGDGDIVSALDRSFGPSSCLVFGDRLGLGGRSLGGGNNCFNGGIGHNSRLLGSRRFDVFGLLLLSKLYKINVLIISLIQKAC
jgi:hypothetical protein